MLGTTQWARLLGRLSLPVVLLAALSGCGGAGGGGDVVADEGGGVGTGADGVTIFWLTYGDSGAANAVQPTADGGFVLAGYTAAVIGEPADGYVAKTDAAGTLAWTASFGGADDDRANALALTSDGGYLVGGLVGRVFGQDAGWFYLHKLDASGNTVAGWPKTYDGNSLEGVFAVIESRAGGSGAVDGYVFVGSGSDQRIAMVKVNPATGQELWRKPYGQAGWGVGLDVRQLGDGGYVVAGADPGGAVLLRTDGDGNALTGWPKNIGPGMAYGVRALADGFVVTGTTTPFFFGADAGDLFVARFDAGGNPLWRKTFGGADHDEGRSIDRTADGGFIVTGRTRSFTNEGQADFLREDVYLIKLTAAGDTAFQKVKGRRALNSELGMAVRTVTGCGVADCGYIVAGASQAKPTLARFDKNGDTVSLGELDVSITVPNVIGTINFGNALAVTAASAQAISVPTLVGEFVFDLLADLLDGNPPSALCDNGGAATHSLTSGPLVAGSVFTVSFSECVSGPAGPDQLKYDGDFTLTVTAVSGDVASGSYTLAATIELNGMTVTDDVGPTTFADGMSFARTAAAGNFTQTASDIYPPTPLTVAESGVSRSLSQFTLGSTRNASGYSWGNPGETVAFTSTDVTAGGGPAALTLSVVNPLSGSDPTAPAAGQFTTTAADGSRVRVTLSGGVATIEVDTDGDGSFDGSMSASWDDL